jgi:hypothetical protein
LGHIDAGPHKQSGDNMPASPQVRQCGGCTACCNTHEIRTLRKPSHSWCPHAKARKGCAIYAGRPSECVEFVCAWLKGVGEDHHRPDRSNVVIDDFQPFYLNGEPAKLAVFFEVKAGGLDGSFARDAAKVYLEDGWVVCYEYCTPGKPDVVMAPRGVNLLEAVAAIQAGSEETVP